MPDGSAPPTVDDPVTQYVPSATPGRRTPHVWLKRSGAQISTIDLIDGRFVLLAGPQGQAWMKAVNSLASPSRPALVAHIIGGSGIADPDGAWPSMRSSAPTSKRAGRRATTRSPTPTRRP